MDWAELIREIGGGLPAAVILALALAVWRLWQRSNAQTDRALEREREHSAEIVETIRAIDGATRALEGRGK